MMASIFCERYVINLSGSREEGNEDFHSFSQKRSPAALFATIGEVP